MLTTFIYLIIYSDFVFGLTTQDSSYIKLFKKEVYFIWFFSYKSGDEIVFTTNGAQLMIFVTKEFELNQSMWRIRRKEIFNLFYLIVSETALSIEHENLLQILYQKHHVLNAVIVAQDPDHLEPNVITYNPFKNASICIPNTVYTRNGLFVEKNSNLHGKPMNIVMYKDTVTSVRRSNGSKSLNFNYDVFLPSLITASMNATSILNTPFTKDFNVEDMQAADMTINGRSYDVGILQDIGIEETISLRRDDICVLVPYNRNRNMFKNVSRMVTPFVWVMTIVVIFQASICLHAIRRLQRIKTWKHIFLFDLFQFHMNQSLTHMPTEGIPRLIIASWLIYCVIINSVFQGSLYTSMANRKDSRISTIDELLMTNEHKLLVSNIFYNYSEYFLNDSPIKNRFDVIDFLEYLNRVESNQIHYTYVARNRGAKYFENVQIVDGLPVYYTMEQCIVPFMTYYFVRRNCPFLDRINYLLRLAEESGLFYYWEEQLTNAYNKLKQHQRLLHHQTFANLENFGFVFEMWSYGLVLSAVAFFIERYASRFKLWYKKLASRMPSIWVWNKNVENRKNAYQKIPQLIDLDFSVIFDLLFGLRPDLL